MKLQKTCIIGCLLLTVFAATLQAQDYQTGIGVRLGYDNGVSLKHFIAPTSALEGILVTSPKYFHLTGLYEYHQPFPQMIHLNWYVGIGGHIGGLYKKNDSNSAFLLGADLIGGMEYTFPNAPFCISLDWKPSFNFTSDYNNGWFYGLALSFRYTIK